MECSMCTEPAKHECGCGRHACDDCWGGCDDCNTRMCPECTEHCDWPGTGTGEAECSTMLCSPCRTHCECGYFYCSAHKDEMISKCPECGDNTCPQCRGNSQHVCV